MEQDLAFPWQNFCFKIKLRAFGFFDRSVDQNDKVFNIWILRSLHMVEMAVKRTEAEIGAIHYITLMFLWDIFLHKNYFKDFPLKR